MSMSEPPGFADAGEHPAANHSVILASSTAFLSGGGEMGALTRAKDWAQTWLGPVSQWPQSLKTAVSICLGSRHPMWVWWGKEHLTQFYNDSFIPVLGPTKHQSALGQPAAVCWSEIWHIIDPMLQGVFATGEATWSEDFLYILDRNLPREEAYFTFSYSPIRDETGAVGGIFCACSETTARVIGERRLRTLHDVSLMEVQPNADRACEVAAQTLNTNRADIPFSLIYLFDEKNNSARLVAASGVDAGSAASPASIALNREDGQTFWPLDRVLRTGAREIVSGLSKEFGSMPGGLWPETSEFAFVVPIPSSGQASPAGVLICGISPRRIIDEDYRSFVNLVAGHIGISISNARAYDEERKRAEALDQIDRAKTLFFSNVSHEFRTPLTLMLGPLEETLRRADLAERDREDLKVVHRNSLRLLKLVNTLLEFSRVEAGRIQAHYRPLDLAALTADLASNFRSACERAGLSLNIDCPPLPQAVYVDESMWEKIVLNLLSNAFKFTLKGGISVSLRANGNAAELRIADTGTGIPEKEMPHLFERFHRIEGARGRTHEGTGIGLALVQELVTLHGGTVSATSTHGEGSTFIIRIPFGTAHLPSGRIAEENIPSSAGTRAEEYVGEALRWLGDQSITGTETGLDLIVPSQEPISGRPYVLLADDNADMRAYLTRLLASRYEIVAVADGQAALRAARERRPDLIITDIMMPVLDGFGLLRAIRADRDLSDVAVIMLSARAGEDARIEGLEAGADDYLVKPFSARELAARVNANLELSRVRREALQKLHESEARFRNMADHAPVMVWCADASGYGTFLNRSWYEFTGQTPETGLGFGWIGAMHPEDQPEIKRVFLEAMATKKPFRLEYRLRRKDGVYRWAIDTAAPWLGSHGEFEGYIGSVIDISDRKSAEEQQTLLLREMSHRMQNLFAVTNSILGLSARFAQSPKELVAAATQRLTALSHAHDLTRPGLIREDGNRNRGTTLHALVRTILAPYSHEQSIARDRFAMSGSDVAVDADAITSVALVLHELATNAVKYGALSSPEGTVSIDCSIHDGEVTLTWTERGGPLLTAEATKEGFGSVLTRRIIEGQFGGQLDTVRAREGLVLRLSLPLDRIARQNP